MNILIDYNLIGKAVDFYVGKGYEHINVDWMVAPQFSFATYRKKGAQFRTLSSSGYAQHLVGSAEQGFIQSVSKKEVEFDRRYVSVTPCFRRGDIGPVNQEWFMKVELSVVSKDNTVWCEEMLEDAWQCFDYLGARQDRMRLWLDDSGQKDIMHEYMDGYLELGSYGYRSLDGLTNGNCLIHYATGLALPRFQLILP